MCCRTQISLALPFPFFFFPLSPFSLSLLLRLSSFLSSFLPSHLLLAFLISLHLGSGSLSVAFRSACMPHGVGGYLFCCYRARRAHVALGGVGGGFLPVLLHFLYSSDIHVFLSFCAIHLRLHLSCVSYLHCIASRRTAMAVAGLPQVMAANTAGCGQGGLGEDGRRRGGAGCPITVRCW